MSERDVAIVGMSCLFPGAPDLATYWDNVIGGVSAISDPPPGSWDPAIFFDPDSAANDRVYCARGGFLGDLTRFEPAKYGVMPSAAAGGEPDQWLALKLAVDALADAGYDEVPAEVRRNTGVILGKGTYLNRGNFSVVQHGMVVDQTMALLSSLCPHLDGDALAEVRGELKSQLPPFNPDTVPGLVPNIIAGRIANRLDLMGPTYTVDAACASSLIALEQAVHGLVSGQLDMALVGGSHVVTPVPILMLFCQLGALSRRQEIRPFDRGADGTILGEGIGMVVLKRRRDAERDGDRMYAVIKAVGVASDGRGIGVMAPRLEGEVLALERAYRSASIDPRTVGLIEAHGTAVPLGDETEVRALRSVFGERTVALPHCGLGSVKSMLGHLMPAAGIAGLIKVALALSNRVLPPTLNCDQPNPSIELEKTPFFVLREPTPWIHGSRATPRRAGVNSFGFGGINAHAVLEEVA
ncbi:MAG TPA: polyketide synthase [Chondromyces sp.]|nr:polyketide synthase [Chondromyces sp.]